MRRFAALVVLFAAGCMPVSNHDAAADAAAAEKHVRDSYSNMEMLRLDVEEPEYVTVAKVPGSRATKPLDRPVTCVARVRFHWREENRTTHDDWLVWLTSDHEVFDSIRNPKGDAWRGYVRSLEQK